MIGKLVYILVSAIIVIGMFEVSYSQIYDLSKDPNQHFTQSYRDILANMYKYRYVVYLVIIISNFVFVFAPLKEVEEDLEEESITKKAKPKKQSYFDYVQERLAIERMMK